MARKNKLNKNLGLVAIAIVALIIFMIFSGTSDSTAKFYAATKSSMSKIVPSSGGTSSGTTGGIEFGGGNKIIVAQGPENNYPACGDLGDNDKDGLIDCNDQDCTRVVCSQAACPQGSAGAGIFGTCPNAIQGFGVSCGKGVPSCSETWCQDGIDNDLDGGADFKDYDCPHVDFVMLGVDKSSIKLNESVTQINYKITFKNAGTISAPPVFPIPPPLMDYFTVSLYNPADDAKIGSVGYKAPVLAGETTYVTIGSIVDLSRVRAHADSDNKHPEPDEKNNIATYNV